MVKCCTVVGCKSIQSERKKNSDSNIRQTSLFKVPKDPDKLKKLSSGLCQNLIPGKYVYELHFHREDVIKNDTILLSDGMIFTSNRKKYSLKHDAIPGILNENNVINNKNCCVVGCGERKGLHRFPTYQLARTVQWISNVGNPRLLTATKQEIYFNARVCDKHFESQYIYPSSRRLARTAVPTLLLPDSINGESWVGSVSYASSTPSPSRPFKPPATPSRAVILPATPSRAVTPPTTPSRAVIPPATPSRTVTPPATTSRETPSSSRSRKHVPYVENLFDVDDNTNNQVHEEIEHPAMTDHEYTPRAYPNKRSNNRTPKEKCSLEKLRIIKKLKSLCRLCCQKQKELLQINEDRILRNHIETFCKIDVKKDDILPTGICFFCYDAIITFHDFIHNVNETQKYYTDIANKIDTNIIQIDLNPTFSYVSSFTTTEEDESVPEKNISNNDICLRDKIDTKKNLSPTFSYLSSRTTIEKDKSVPERNLSNNDICLRDKTAINLNTTCNDISSHTVIEEVIIVPDENITSNNDMCLNINENNYNKNNTKVIKTNFKINSDNIIKSVTKRKRKQNLANIEIDRSDAEPTNHIISQQCLPENWLKINTNKGDLKATNLIQIRPLRSEKQIDPNQEQKINANQIMINKVNLIPIKTKLANLSEPTCSKSTTKLATVTDIKKIKLATNIKYTK